MSEDPEIIPSLINNNEPTNHIYRNIKIDYLKNDKFYRYVWDYNTDTFTWQESYKNHYTPELKILGLTRSLHSPGSSYDTVTHEYLGEYLRFLRDYYNVNLMSLYNCFNNQICNNIYFSYTNEIPKKPSSTIVADDLDTSLKNGPNEDGFFYINNEKQSKYKVVEWENNYYFIADFDKYLTNTRRYIKSEYLNDTPLNEGYYLFDPKGKMTAEPNTITFDSLDSNYKIYTIPVKVFENYTLAIDCASTVELFCGFYRTQLDLSEKGKDLITTTYTKIKNSIFSQPILFDKLSVDNWGFTSDSQKLKAFKQTLIENKKVTCWDLIDREQDLKLFLKIPTSCKSTITLLEGDYRNFNDFKFDPKVITNVVVNSNGETETKNIVVYQYKQNSSILNFNKKDVVDIQENFIPISPLQLLSFNTGESYPFANRLIEYLSGSAITPLDEITDNIRRAQRVMEQNGYYFQIPGRWETKMQKLTYDYVLNSGPIQIAKDENNKPYLTDKRRGYHSILGQKSQSGIYDILGYIDRDAEKWYASWTLLEVKNKEATDPKQASSKYEVIVKDTIQNVDIYNGLYNI